MKSVSTRMKTVTAVTLAIAAAVMLVAGFAAPRTSATPQLCHVTQTVIAAPATAKARSVVAITGGEGAVPQHSVTATLQYRKASSKAWINGASKSLSNGAYSLKWKAPKKIGKYKVRVRVTHAGASHTSAVKTVVVN